MSKKAWCLAALFLQSGISFAQAQNNIWVFGRNDGLDFNSGVPVQITSSVDTREPAGAVANAAGKLLFYTSGTVVYDRTHAAMPNGTGLTADLSTTQGTVIVPFVNDTNKYYVFTINGRDTPPPHYLRYSIVDMTRNGGLGDIDVSTKNTILDSSMTEKMTVVQGNGCYNWVLVHTLDSPANFHAFKVDAAGVHSTPVISYVGSGNKSAYLIGEMKASPDNKLVAAQSTTRILTSPGVYFYKSLELYDFDNSTGVVSNKRLIDTIQGGEWQLYGCEFSPDSKKLYYGSANNFGWSPFTGIIQYDLSLLPSIPAVRSSRYYVSGGIQCMGMRTGPDKKIYVTRLPMSPAGIGVAAINNPNGTGAACSPVDDIGITVRFAWTFGMPVVPYLDTARVTLDTTICTNDPFIVINAPAGYAAYKWDDGDTARSRKFSSSIKRKAYMTMGAGTSCGNAVYTYNITKLPADSSGSVTDTTICFLQHPGVTLRATPGYTTYLWNDGDTSRKRTFTAAGLHWVTAKNVCTVHSDTFNILSQKEDTAFYVTDTTVCFQPSVFVQAPSGYMSHTWSDGHSGTGSSFSASGTQWLVSRFYCNVRIDTFHARLINFTPGLGNDTLICDHTQIHLDASVSGASYLWQDGSSGSFYTVGRAGKYWVKVSVEGCAATDSIEIARKDFSADLGSDRLLCNGAVIQLATDRAEVNYLWQDGSTGQTFTVSQPGEYWLRLSEGVCVASDTVQVTYTRCDDCMMFPSAFTPGNEDGLNDLFRPRIFCNTLDYAFRVFNRYGQEVFTTRNPTDGWDGTINGVPAELGVYYYMAKVLFGHPGATEEIFKGDVTLLR